MPHPWPIFTRRDRFEETREWLQKRASDRVWERYAGSLSKDSRWQDVLDAIVALGDNPDFDAVDGITGNPTWTRYQCDECDNLVDAVIRLGEDPPDYDFDTINICITCLNKAVVQLEEI